MTWRPFEPSKEETTRVEREATDNTCNRHRDCAAADAKAKASGLGRLRADHCYDSCCEECFGS